MKKQKKISPNLNEEEVREALGVERLYEVSFRIPTTGHVFLYPLVVSALNEKDARDKAASAVFNGEGREMEVERDYEASEDASEWEFNVIPKEKGKQNER